MRARGISTDDAAQAGALREVRAVYDELARRPVVRDCVRRTECCRFKLTGLTPYLTAGEALLAAKAWRATGRRELPHPADGSCPMLAADGRCLVYESRPFGCRTHFCEAAGGPVERRGVLDLIRRLEAVDEALSGRGPLPLSAAVRDGLEALPNRRPPQRQPRRAE
jgi:Fe-S-cluster containining protein